MYNCSNMLINAFVSTSDDILHKLKHLTASIRLDYYQMMDDIDRVKFFAAQQMEAGLRNYQPQKVVVRKLGCCY